MPTTPASSASSGQGREHRRENSQATNRIRERTVRANGLDFPILEAGSGRLVLCLHGFPDHAQSWAHFLDRLAQEGYWAVAPALRGYGPVAPHPTDPIAPLATGRAHYLGMPACRRRRQETAEYLEELGHADYGRPLHVQRGPHATGARS